MQKGTSQKHSTRPPLSAQAHLKELVMFVCMTSSIWQALCQRPSEFVDFEIQKDAITAALFRAKFHRRFTMRETSNFSNEQQARLDWAHKHGECTIEQ
jgi:hypothetical protein